MREEAWPPGGSGRDWWGEAPNGKAVRMRGQFESAAVGAAGNGAGGHRAVSGGDGGSGAAGGAGGRTPGPRAVRAGGLELWGFGAAGFGAAG